MIVDVLIAGFVISVLGILATVLVGARLGRGDTGERAINANHHGLYLLVNDLATIQNRGYQPVFPDVETSDRARALLAGYEEQLVAMPPRAPATSDRALTAEGQGPAGA
jgi:hypothetical protein